MVSNNRPVEICEVKITPSDFFTGNPSLDVPSNGDHGSKLTEGAQCCSNGTNGTNGTNGIESGVAGLQVAGN